MEISHAQIPKEKGTESILSLMKEGYLFIQNRCQRLNSDIFETKLLSKRVICITGSDASQIFYDSQKFERKNALPKRVQKTLTGENSIQGMDGQAHLHRKQLFMRILDKESEEKLSTLLMERWVSSVDVWQNKEDIVLFEESIFNLTEVACTWVGIPITRSEIKTKAMDFAAMVDGFGAIGPRHGKGKSARKRTEDWIQQIIDDVRLGEQLTVEGSVLHTISFSKDHNGILLDSKIAAIELINIIRPIVAISTYITFMAVALHENPRCKMKLQRNEPDYFNHFVSEVKRFYPFTPFLGAIVKQDFTWKNYHFPEGTTVLLDVYGLSHSNTLYTDPDVFYPERFEHPVDSVYSFIPHGGGSPATGHRCPGEGITTELMKVTLDFLVNKIEYEVPEQNFHYDLGKIPTLPKSKFIMKKVHSLEI